MPLQTDQPDLRAYRRTKMFLSATMELKDSACPVKVRNLSPTGAMIEAREMPNPGTTLMLSRGGLAAAAEVVWSKPEFFGVRFTMDVDVARWIAEGVSQSSGKAPLTKGVTASEADSSHAAERSFDDTVVLSRMSEEISYLGRVMGHVGHLLSEDPLLRHRHGRIIQEVAMGEEKLDQLAAVLKSSDLVDAVERSITGSMRARLLRD